MLQLSRILTGDTITVKASKPRLKLVFNTNYNDDNIDVSEDVNIHLD